MVVVVASDEQKHMNNGLVLFFREKARKFSWLMLEAASFRY